MCFGGSNTVVQQSGPPAQVLQNYQNLVSQGQGVAGALNNAPGPPVAGLSQNQLYGINDINAAGTMAAPYFNTGSNYLQGGYGTVSNSLGLIPQAAGLLGSSLPYYQQGASTVGSALPYYQQGASAVGQSIANPISPTQFSAGALNQYLSPYNQDVISATEAQFNNQNAQQANNLTGSAIMGGNAFGGDRAGVAQGVLAGQQQAAEAPVIAGLENQNYTQALNEFNAQQQMGVGAQEATAGLRQSAGGLYGNLGAGTAGLGTAYGQLGSGIAGVGQGFGSLAGLGGSLGATQAGIGSQYAALGPAAQNTQLAQASAQLQGGGLLQAQQQAQLNSQYQQYLNSIGLTGTSYLAPLVEGTGALSGGTGTTTSPAPSAISQIAGLGIGSLGLLGATGGLGSTGYLSGLGSSLSGLLGSGGLGAATDVALNGGIAAGGDALGALGTLALAHRGGRMNYDGGGSVDDSGLTGSLVEANALTRQLGNAQAADQLAANLEKGVGFADGGMPQSPQLGQVPGVMPQPAIGAPGQSPIADMRKYSSQFQRGVPNPPQPYQDQSINTILNQIKQVAPALRQMRSSMQQDAFGGRVEPGLVPQGFAGGGFATAPSFMPQQGGMQPGMPIQRPGGGLAGNPAAIMAAMRARGMPQGGGLPRMARGGFADGGDADVNINGTGLPTDSSGTFAANPDNFGGPIPNAVPPTQDQLKNAVVPIPNAIPFTGDTSKLLTPANAPRGIRNNNPGNIEDSEFARSQPGYVGQDGRFAKFESPAAGLAAMDSLVRNYKDKGINTISGIVNRWAPASDNNDTQAYASAVGKWTGIDPNKPVDLSDPNVRQAITAAMARYENGQPVGGVPTQSAGLASAYSAPSQRMASDDGVSNALPPTSQASTIGKIDPWLALATAGFGMAASTSPFAGVNIGRGALAGLQNVEEQRQQLREDLTVKQRADQLAEMAKYHAGQLENETRRTTLAEQQAQLEGAVRARTAAQPFIAGERMTIYGPQKVYAIQGPNGQLIDAMTKQPIEQSLSLPGTITAPNMGQPSTPNATPVQPQKPPSVSVPESKVKTADGAEDDAALPLRSILNSYEPPEGVHPEVLNDPNLTEGQKNKIKAIGDGRAAFLPLQRGNVQNQMIMDKVYEYNPNIDQATFGRRQKTENFYAVGTAGGGGQQVVAINRWLAHSGSLMALAEKLNMGDYTTLNDAKIWLAQHGYGSKETQDLLGAWDVNAKGAGDEGAKVFAGKDPALGDRETWNKILSPDTPLHTIRAKLQQAAEMGHQALASNVANYNEGMRTNHSPREFLTPRSQLVLDTLESGKPMSSVIGGAGSKPQQQPATQSNANPVLDDARAAIAKGAPRDAVIERLKMNGIDPSGL